MPQFNPGVPQNSGTQRSSSGLPWLLLLFSIVLISFSVVIYIGLKAYSQVVKNGIDAVDEQLSELRTEVEAESQRNFLDIYSQISNVQKVLQSHPELSQFFTALEGKTNTRAKYKNVGVNVKRREVTIQGVAENYDRLAEQLESLKQMTGVSQAVLQSSKATPTGIVDFTIVVTVAPVAFIPPTTQ